MPKISGKNWTTLGVDTSAGSLTDLRNDVVSFDFATPRGTQDVTGVDKSAMERLLLLSDFSINLSGIFNADTSHPVLKTISSTDAVRTVSLGIASQTLSNECLLTDYALTRANGGEFTWTVPGVLANGATPQWS
ncbi:hypothetical protein [Streptomyces sp. VNUA74]|uniref:hypothetical protein n=1 Tax=Streptomyces sp. VNUA74 TaxID=3062685 RepID=UPI00280B028F|nr:hypothetical protein [Streptomyces sp. VNUA74]WML79186.1 hypothetical protein Q3101_04735 [Streptomyces sp. VNUA74]